MSELSDWVFLQMELDSEGLWKTLEKFLNEGSLSKDNIKEVLIEEIPKLLKLKRLSEKEV